MKSLLSFMSFALITAQTSIASADLQQLRNMSVRVENQVIRQFLNLDMQTRLELRQELLESERILQQAQRGWIRDSRDSDGRGGRPTPRLLPEVASSVRNLIFNLRPFDLRFEQEFAIERNLRQSLRLLRDDRFDDPRPQPPRPPRPQPPRPQPPRPQPPRPQPPFPQPPQPQPDLGFHLCQGTYVGTYQNGRPLQMTLTRQGFNNVIVQITSFPRESYVGTGTCQVFGNQVSLVISLNGAPTHHATILADGTMNGSSGIPFWARKL